MDYEAQFKDIFKIEEFPHYPNTGDVFKDASDFAKTYKKVTLLKSDPVYYTNRVMNTEKPQFIQTKKG